MPESPESPALPLAAGVPEQLRPTFEAAQRRVAAFFERREHRPDQGTIRVDGERYLLVRAASLSTEFVARVMHLYEDRGEHEAREVANAMLFDLAHTIGRNDARAFHARMGVSDPVEKLAAGPIHFAFTGWARVELDPESVPTPDENFFLHYRHPNAFECDAWAESHSDSPEPVCIMNAGYSAGWCEESFGVPLVAMEYTCRTLGDPACWFVMAPPHRIQAHLDRVTGEAGSRRPWSQRLVPELFGRKRLEEELRQHRDQLERLVTDRTRALEEINQRLRDEARDREQAESALRQAQKLEAVGSLAGGIAHDFNNVLTAIHMGLEFAMSELDPGSEVGESVADALRSTRQAAQLVKRLMSISRPQKPDRGPMRPERLVEQLAALLRRIQPAAVELRTTFEAGWEARPPLLLDAHQIEQALLNLALNAADAMPDGGPLDLRVRTERVRNSDFVVFEVEDAGVGIPLEQQERIFEPFFTTKQHSEGSGLGLAMVQSVVEAHEGWVELDSELGRGTEFRLYLPLRRAPAPEPAAGPGKASSGDPDASLRLLVVDDELEVRDSLARLLRKHGMRVSLAADGLEALDLLERDAEHIDLVLTDLNMPRLDGKGLVEAIEEAGYAMPVILSSGYLTPPAEGSSYPVDRRAHDHPRFAAVLPKPYAIAELLSLIREVVGQRTRGPGQEG